MWLTLMPCGCRGGGGLKCAPIRSKKVCSDYLFENSCKHTEEYDLYSESGHVNKQRSKHSLCFKKENMIDI